MFFLQFFYVENLEKCNKNMGNVIEFTLEFFFDFFKNFV